MSARIFLTGGSGFVGSAVIDVLLSRGHAVTALSHRRSISGHGESVQTFQGDLFDSARLAEGMRGCNAVIHLVGIIMEKPSRGVTFERIHFEGTKSVVDAAQSAGVSRYLHMSALGVRPNARSQYHQTKFLAEQYVRASGLDWTIFRPSLIHGPKGEFMQMEAKWARMSAPPFIFMPYFGGKKAGKLQPVYVNDVAKAFADALSNKTTIREIYPIGGPDQMTWPQMHHIASRAIVARKRLTGWMPVPIAKIIAMLPGAPYNRDQVIMSQEDNTCDLSKLRDAFGWEPQGFEATLKSYAGKL